MMIELMRLASFRVTRIIVHLHRIAWYLRTTQVIGTIQCNISRHFNVTEWFSQNKLFTFPGPQIDAVTNLLKDCYK